MATGTSEDISMGELGPDGRALHSDLRSPAFSYGADAGWWREVGWAFPNVDIVVAAAPREGAPKEFVFRFECTNYKQQAPLCVVWDAEANGPLPLSQRPFGRDQVGIVFRRDWEGGKYLYTPLDRYALQTHSDWPAKYRSAWKVTSELADYLNHLHGLLNSRSYTGLAGP